MQNIKAYIRKVPIANNISSNQVNITIKEKNNIIVKLKNLNFSDLNKKDINAILYNENLPTFRTTKVENYKKNLVFTFVSSEEKLILDNEKINNFS